MLLRAKLLLPALLIFLAGQPLRGEGVPPRVRVGLVRGVASLEVSAADGATVLFPPGGSPLNLPPGEVCRAQAGLDGARLVRADGSEVGGGHQQITLTPSPGSTLTLRDLPGHWDQRTKRDYRGVIEIRADGAGALTVVNVVDVETYLRGVVPSEMPDTYPRAALQAQAVTARGQAILKAGRHEADGFGLCNGPHCQVYGGATSESAATDEAVSSTRGEVLVHEGQLADTLYSSNCGGHTANNEDYWPAATPLPYLRGVEDFEAEDEVPYAFPLSEAELGQFLKYAPRVNCNQPKYAKTDKIRWWLVKSREELQKTLTDAVGDFGELLGVRVAKRAESGMVTKLAIIGSKRPVTVEGGAKARRALGVISPSFAVEAIGGKDDLPGAFVLWGAGWGHQVGMCQVGAAGLADKGWDYRRILAKYYRGTEVEKRY
jgi:stage II sporulation protein D